MGVCVGKVKAFSNICYLYRAGHSSKSVLKSVFYFLLFTHISGDNHEGYCISNRLLCIGHLRNTH